MEVIHHECRKNDAPEKAEVVLPELEIVCLRD
jgi:hypothetical protein